MKHAMERTPDFPDLRDYAELTEGVRVILKSTGLSPGISSNKPHRGKSLPALFNLGEWCSPVKRQGLVGSCTAQAGAGIIEYYKRKPFSRHIDTSMLFLYIE